MQTPGTGGIIHRAKDHHFLLGRRGVNLSLWIQNRTEQWSSEDHPREEYQDPAAIHIQSTFIVK